MNAKNKSIILYIVAYYPEKPISIIRLIRIVFLSEWYSVLIRKTTMSNMIWYRRNYGPYSDDFSDALISSKINIEKGISEDGACTVASISNLCDISDLSEDDIGILKLAMKHTSELDFSELDDYIENLLPIKNTNINAEIRIQEFSENT